MLLPLLLLSLGCTPDPASQDDSATPAGDDTGAPEEPVEGPLNGSWMLAFSVKPVGNLVLPFQAEITDETFAGDHTITRFGLRATDSSGSATSEELTFVEGVTVDAEGSFTATFPTMTLPPEFSPSGGEIDVAPILSGTIQGDGSFCGDLNGEVVTFEIDLAGSTFGAIPWEERESGARSSCDATSGGIDRMDPSDCPTLAAGINTGFASGDDARSFEVVLPADYSEDALWPLIFVFHGWGGSSGGMLDDTGLRAYADSLAAILVVPQAGELGGQVAWDVVNGEDNNVDLAFFDDMSTCLPLSLSVDPQHIAVTGMSSGGLFTGLVEGFRGADLSAAAPMSGGDLVSWPEDVHPPPTLVTWGGEEDSAFDQDFNAYSLDLIAKLEEQGALVATCDHGLGHELEADFWPWIMEFLLDHPQGLTEEPYADALPGDFPEYCSLPD